jgi:flavorubredoxin
MSTVVDTNEPVEIASGIFWVGHRSELDFEMNVYLRIFEGNGKKINMLIDPGPHTDFEQISAKVEKVLGPDEKIHIAYINHQDPDVCINTIFFQRHYPAMQVITTEDTWRLIRFYGLKKDRFVPVDNFKSGRIKLQTGHKLRFIYTPYAHFRGACCLYDAEQSVLFSGDLFGGLTNTPDLYADESYWEGVKTFHQIYMPVNIALKKAVTDFRSMAPEMKMIAPQHGKIIRQDLLSFYMTRLEKLQVGLDLTTSRLVSENYISAFNEVLAEISSKVDPIISSATLKAYDSDGSFPGIFVVKDGKILSIKIELADALQSFAAQLCGSLTREQKKMIRPIFVNALENWHIDSDDICPDSGNSSVKENADDTEKLDKLLDDVLDL